MFTCPYCMLNVSSKQRLISHLTKNNKCYDINVIGFPPLLIKLMGGTLPQVAQATQKTQKTQVQKSFLCPHCSRSYVSKKNVERHINNNKCPKFKVLRQVLPLEHESSQVQPTCRPSSLNTSKTAEHRVKTKENPVQKPQPQVTVESEDLDEKIKYIVKDNYTNYLYNKMGKEKALSYIKSCVQSKLRGDINLVYKIHFEGRESDDYPILTADKKGKNLYYKKSDGSIVNDNDGEYVKSTLVANVQNCYLKFCNHIIESNMDDNEVIFTDYDLSEIQKHLIELGKDSIKNRFLSGLIDMVKFK